MHFKWINDSRIAEEKNNEFDGRVSVLQVGNQKVGRSMPDKVA